MAKSNRCKEVRAALWINGIYEVGTYKHGDELHYAKLPKSYKWVKYVGQWYIVPANTVFITMAKPRKIVACYSTKPKYKSASGRWYAESSRGYINLADPIYCHHPTLKPENSLRLVNSNNIAVKPDRLC